MALLTQRVLRGLVPALDPDRTPVHRTRPERIILGVKPGHRPSSKPPVRIFLGSERSQFRAERVFLWSVEKHRDPSRIYQIYLLKGLAGFGGRFWLTGFTNYRFAIPYYSDFSGRAIYNDTDQVYLRDPAELFDHDMHGAGFLSINDRDTSVMLIDCARMCRAWDRQAVFGMSRKKLEARARAEQLWGPLDGCWNARDAEYDPDDSACVHFTTLHTQPWRPLPRQFVYFDNPTGSLWPDLEAEADRAGFMPVSAMRPSSAWPDFALALSGQRRGTELRALLGPNPPDERIELRRVSDLLEQVPDADLPWVLERLFATSRRLEVRLHEPVMPRLARQRRSRSFWVQQFQRAERLQPATRWKVNRHTGLKRAILCGGPAEDGPIQVLVHGKPGHAHQARRLAEQLARATGRELVHTPLPFGPAGYLLRRIFRLPLPEQLKLRSAVLVGSGWLPTRAARWAARRREHHPGLVLMGRKAGPVPDCRAAVIGCRHFGLPPHPNRLDTLLPLNRGTAHSDVAESDTWQHWLDAPRRVALLAGGSSRSHHLDQAGARQLTRAALDWAAERNAELLIVTSRRTRAVLPAILETAGDQARVYQFGDPDNPYALALARADALMITGESESMLADGIHAGKPVTIWPLARRNRLWERLGDAVARRATRPRYNKRGSIRPQQGLTYLCARALERNWILPRRNLESLHEELVQRGLATWAGSASTPARRLESEPDHAAAWTMQRLGLEPNPDTRDRDNQEQSEHDPNRHSIRDDRHG